MGIYAFKIDILLKALIEDSHNSSSPHDFGYAILPRLVNRQKLMAFEFKDYWRDIGTVDSYYDTSLEILARWNELWEGGLWPVLNSTKTQPVYLGNMFRGVLNSPISRNCIIRGHVENCIISPGVVIEEGATIFDSIVMANCHIGSQTAIRRCILDEDVNVGEFCQIGSVPDSISNDREITVLGQRVSIPERTIIESRCKILPGVGPSILRSNYAHAGTVVST